MSVLGKVATVVDTTLDEIKVVPNPYIVRSRFNETTNSRKMRFTNLPQECRISIFTVTGEIVKVIERSSQFDETSGGIYERRTTRGCTWALYLSCRKQKW